jgi:23S rRNA pseudouridine2605 synthase
MRLQKYISQAGVASRRKAEELISQGRVSVNDSVVTEMGTTVADDDKIKVDGKLIKLAENKIYIVLNKPTGYVTTSKDQFGRPSVIDLIPEIKERVFPVGRLDYATSGLLILTNDGDYANKMMHPSKKVNKIYEARIKGVPSKVELERFENGLEIDGQKTLPASIKIIKNEGTSSIVTIKISQGRNRQIRKMCDLIGHPVTSLKRTGIGGLSLGNLPEGKWRYFTID